MTSDSPLKVLVVDDQPLFAQSVVAAIAAVEDLACIAVGSNGAEAVRLAAQHHPDVVLLDHRMPVMDGIEATRRILAGTEPPKVIILTLLDDEETFHASLLAGVSGFLLKTATAAEITQAIRVVATGEAILSPELITTVLAGYRRTLLTAAGQRLRLSARETALLRVIGEGLNNSEIAERLFYSPATVKTYVSRLLTRTGARDRAQLVVIAYQQGLMN